MPCGVGFIFPAITVSLNEFSKIPVQVPPVGLAAVSRQRHFSETGRAGTHVTIPVRSYDARYGRLSRDQGATSPAGGTRRLKGRLTGSSNIISILFVNTEP